KPADVARWLNEAAARDQEQLVRRAGVFGAFGANASPLVHDQRISTHVLRFSEPFEWVDFSEALDLLQSAVGKQLLRIKGLVAVKGENAPRVIHAVQHERYPATSLSAWPDEDHDSRLVFIVRDLPRSIPEHAFATICNLHTVSPKKRCDLAS
ncbi:MAG TPA: GTP-binding protein, partial [Rhodocyclaceae bacterium]|nr:GTP-binding protein [Rhodocyclaceae bacterium]